ncbi:patatin-like phospholipase family protein [Rhizobium binxianense]|uniref:patatin-like phospholipase family protein n=1 Tax=Rhizobium binxianense TaxID=3024242 RepID=UPI0023629EAD|nr:MULTISPECIES: patatin-like phospholipase family protein [unclassified Rhizobium]MDC9812434.1 patatin-like phospholipase family protein [Rhizobium sp. MC62]MDC9835726.1 patatin-like phospholipase family protein [Rhizobium sp. MJ37]WEA27131.1 patatin-like phospholipase family protein [Rhizobium sp. MJ22]WEA61607.1 patatin-like phospholipase family protein [Rhizobium sp. BJ04]
MSEDEHAPSNAVSSGSDDPEKPAERYKLGLCLSGGGYRAMLFHAGSLARLNEAGLLAKLDMISSVSGGSIASGLLAYIWPRLVFKNEVAVNFKTEYLDRILALSQVFADGPSFLKGVFNPFSSAAEEAAKLYERHLFDGRSPSLRDLPRSPWFVFCASNLSTGSLFRMSNRYIADYRIGVSFHPTLSLATAVAASAAFPPVLSPLRLDLSQFSWKREKLDDTVGEPVAPGRAILSDGGVYDNHGIEPALKRCDCLLVSDAGAPWRSSTRGYWNYLSQLKRVLDTTDNQVRSLRRRDLISGFRAAKQADMLGLDDLAKSALRARTHGVYWSIDSKDAELKPYASYTLPPSSVVPSEIGTYLHFVGAKETEHLTNWGHYVCDAMLNRFYQPLLAPSSGPPLASGTVKPSWAARASKRLFDILPF